MNMCSCIVKAIFLASLFLRISTFRLTSSRVQKDKSDIEYIIQQ